MPWSEDVMVDYKTKDGFDLEFVYETDWTMKEATVEVPEFHVEYVGLNIKGLGMQNMSRSGDVMVYRLHFRPDQGARCGLYGPEHQGLGHAKHAPLW